MSDDIPFYHKNPDFYSDPKSYKDMQYEKEDALIEESLNPLSGIRNWLGMSLSNYNDADTQTANQLQGERLAVNLRIQGTMDYCIPNPCADIWENEEDKKRLISLHPIAFSTRPLGNGEAPPSFGQLLQCRFEQGGPALKGKHRGVQYDYASSRNALTYNCVTGKTSLVTTNFTSTLDQKIPPPLGGKISNGKIIKGGLNLNWEELKTLVSTGAFEAVLSNIAKHESGKAAYDAYNRGSCSDCGSLGDTGLIAVYGRKLSELTIATITDRAMKEGKLKGHSLFATGKYQITPGTLRSAIERIQGCDTGEVYGKEQQEAFGLYLLLMKRSKLGKYLLGDTSISAAEAQLHHRKATKCRRAVDLVPGNSYYKDYDNWCKGDPPPKKDSNPDDIRLSRAKTTAASIEKTRQAVDNNPDAQKVAQKAVGGSK